MTVHLNLSNLKNGGEAEENARVHYMPCIIRSNGEAKVSAYFEPVIRKENGDVEVMESSFRGHPLQGKEMKVPQGYCGVVLEGTNNGPGESCERNVYGTHKFNKFTYWNWDAEPSDSDRIVTAMDWLDIAEALHSPADS